MGNAFANLKRSCEYLWAFSTSRAVAAEHKDLEAANQALEEAELERKLEEETKRQSELKAQQEWERKSEAEKLKKETFEKVHVQVESELKELRKTLEQLSTELQQPTIKVELWPEDAEAPFTRLDDYVHETMYALLMWLSARDWRDKNSALPKDKSLDAEGGEQLKSGQPKITMGSLMFYLKSPHIKQRKKYLLHVERILRSHGLSLFEVDQEADTRALAGYFNILDKRKIQAEQEKKQQAEFRSTWRAYV